MRLTIEVMGHYFLTNGTWLAGKHIDTILTPICFPQMPATALEALLLETPSDMREHEFLVHSWICVITSTKACELW